MSDKNSITIAGDWSKPAQLLIEKVSDAIGGAFAPLQLKRIAEAEAEARIIHTKAEIDAEDMLQAAGYGNHPLGTKAIQRMISQEIRKQVNLENITRLAIEKLEEDANPAEMEEDFVADLLEKAANTSDSEMQSLWASILAGEANKQGSFSKRTVNLVSQLDKRDAELFTKFCQCVWLQPNGRPAAVFTNSVKTVMEAEGITFEEITHLDSLGLLRFDPLSGFILTLQGEELPATLLLFYFGDPVFLKFEKNPKEMASGAALLTEAGTQLARISGATPNKQIYEAAVSDLLAPNRTLYSPWPRQHRSTL